MADLPDDIARINALTTNARNTWFALLGVLVFVSITLMRVEHIDFYGVDRATQLPLVNVEVPTNLFFIAAPILTVAIYGYFHLYLIRLWDALGKAESRHNGQALGDVVSPWLVTDAALTLRRWTRKDNDPCCTPRTMDAPAMALNFLLAWGFGIIVLSFLWWQSMPARSFLLTGTAGAALVISLFIGAASLAMSVIRMSSPIPDKPINIWSSVPAMTTLLVITPSIVVVCYQRTEGPTDHLASISLQGKQLTNRLKGWLPRELSEEEFRKDWCQRYALKCNELRVEERKVIYRNWSQHRNSFLEQLRVPRISNFDSLDVVDFTIAQQQALHDAAPDFRRADMRLTFMPGVNLTGASFQYSDASGANFESAELSRTVFDHSTLIAVDFGGVDLDFAQLRHVDAKASSFFGSRLQRAILHFAKLQSADFKHANLIAAEFNNAELERATFNYASLVGTKFEEAEMRFTKIIGASMQNTNFKNADLSFSYLYDSNEVSNMPREASFDGVIADGTAFRKMNLRYIDYNLGTDFRNSFMDGSVKLRSDWKARKGIPCQWVIDRELGDEEFFAHWLGWLHKHPDFSDSWIKWESLAPREFWHVTAIRPASSCKWQLDNWPGKY